MPKTQENYAKLRPLHLYQANIGKNNLTYFFITYFALREKIWVKQTPNDWEEINIDNLVPIRDGEKTYTLSGNGYTKLFIPSGGKHLPTISRKNGSWDLDEILMSKQKLEELGITKHLELDLSEISEVTTQEQETAHKDRLEYVKIKSRTQYLKPAKHDWFDEMIASARCPARTARIASRLATSSFLFSSAGSSPSESGASSNEKLKEEISKLAL